MDREEIIIVYWSGTGNTEIMAKAIKKGIEEKRGSVSLRKVEETQFSDVEEADAIVFGSPSMGQEKLAEEMEDFICQIEKVRISDKIVGAFGSYDWGDGEWMRDFGERLKNDGFDVIGNGLIIKLIPDEGALKKCQEYGKMILEKIKQK